MSSSPNNPRSSVSKDTYIFCLILSPYLRKRSVSPWLNFLDLLLFTTEVEYKFITTEVNKKLIRIGLIMNKRMLNWVGYCEQTVKKGP